MKDNLNTLFELVNNKYLDLKEPSTNDDLYWITFFNSLRYAGIVTITYFYFTSAELKNIEVQQMFFNFNTNNKADFIKSIESLNEKHKEFGGITLVDSKEGREYLSKFKYVDKEINKDIN